MALYRRGNVWWVKIPRAGKPPLRLSTQQKVTSDKPSPQARKFEALMVAKVESGESLFRKKAPLLRDFLPDFKIHNSKRVDIGKKSKAYYASGVKLLEASVLPSMFMDTIKPVVLQSVSFGHSASNENMGRRTLSRVFRHAHDLGVITERLKVPMLQEWGRSILIDAAAEAKVLALGIQPLSDVVVIGQDTGMRPGEVVGMRVEYVRSALGHYQNPHGKTPQARRKCGISLRMIPILKRLIAGRMEGWLFAGRHKGKHISLSHVEHQWADVRLGLGLPKGMVLYCARHTWATEVGQHVGLAELQQGGGWSDAKIPMRYQHPGAARILEAVNRRNELPN